MTYEIEDNHTEEMCDKCLKTIGKMNLIPVEFLFLDYNDRSHKDLGNGYRQYYVCEDCIDLY